MQRIASDDGVPVCADGAFACLSWTDWLFAVSISAFFLILCAVRSRTRLLWGDELLGYRVIGAPTLHAMLRGWWQGADGGGLFYYLLARLWVKLFGLSELSLRLFSTAGMCIALILTWAAARRYFSTAVVALSVTVVYMTPAVMLWQQLNGRFYGLFLASAALASLAFLLSAERSPTWSELVLTSIAHTLLIGSHILGLVYSFSLIAGTLALDVREHRFRPRLYLAALSGWIMVPVSYHAIRESASIAAAGGFWTQAPRLKEYALGFVMFGKPTLLLLAGLAIVWATQRFFLHKTTPRCTLPWPALYLMGSLVLAQTILFAKSQVGTSIYADRYLLPMSIGTVFLFAFCFRGVLAQIPGRWHLLDKESLIPPIAVLLLCGAYTISRRTNYALYPERGYPQRLVANIPSGATVLSNSLVFELLSTYDPLHRAVTPFDWRYSLALDRREEYSDQRLMQNWKRAGYEEANILPCDQAFSQPDTLYILVDPRQTTWFQEHLVQDHALYTERVATFSEWQPLTLWLVRRLAPGPAPC